MVPPALGYYSSSGPFMLGLYPPWPAGNFCWTWRTEVDADQKGRSLLFFLDKGCAFPGFPDKGQKLFPPLAEGVLFARNSTFHQRQIFRFPF